MHTLYRRIYCTLKEGLTVSETGLLCVFKSETTIDFGSSKNRDYCKPMQVFVLQGRRK